MEVVLEGRGESGAHINVGEPFGGFGVWTDVSCPPTGQQPGKERMSAVNAQPVALGEIGRGDVADAVAADMPAEGHGADPMSTTGHLERLALGAHQAGATWTMSWERHGAEVCRAEPRDRQRLTRLVRRLVAARGAQEATEALRRAGEVRQARRRRTRSALER